MNWTPLNFGRHEGKTLPQIVFCDPDCFFWAYEQQLFQGNLEEEADLIHAKATNIQIPGTPEESRVVDYCVHPVTGKFVYMEIHAPGRANVAGTTVAESLAVIDMSVPRRICGYDKQGGKRTAK